MRIITIIKSMTMIIMMVLRMIMIMIMIIKIVLIILILFLFIICQCAARLRRGSHFLSAELHGMHDGLSHSCTVFDWKIPGLGVWPCHSGPAPCQTRLFSLRIHPPNARRAASCLRQPGVRPAPCSELLSGQEPQPCSPSPCFDVVPVITMKDLSVNVTLSFCSPSLY